MAFAIIATGNCSGYGNLANLALNSAYGSPSSSSAAAASSDGAGYGAAPSYSSYGAAPSYSSYGAAAPSYSSYGSAAPSYSSYSAPAKSYASKYSVQPTFATELYPGQQNYKQYNSPATYSQVALPVVQDAPLAKLYAPAAPKSYGGYGSSAY